MEFMEDLSEVASKMEMGQDPQHEVTNLKTFSVTNYCNFDAFGQNESAVLKGI